MNNVASEAASLDRSKNTPKSTIQFPETWANHADAMEQLNRNQKLIDAKVQANADEQGRLDSEINAAGAGGDVQAETLATQIQQERQNMIEQNQSNPARREIRERSFTNQIQLQDDYGNTRLDDLWKRVESGDMSAALEFMIVKFSDLNEDRGNFFKNLFRVGNTISSNDRMALVNEAVLADTLRSNPAVFQEYIQRENPNIVEDFMRVQSRAELEAIMRNLNMKFQADIRDISTLQQAISGNLNNASIDFHKLMLHGKDAYAKMLVQNSDIVKGTTDQLNSDQKSRLSQVLSTLLSIGVSIMIPGMYVSYSEKNISPEDFAKANNVPRDKMSATLGNGKTNMRAKLDLLSVTLEWNLNDRFHDIRNRVNDFSTTLRDKSDQIAALQQEWKTQEIISLISSALPGGNLEASTAVQSFASGEGAIAYEDLVDMLAYDRMITLARTEAWWEPKGVEVKVGLAGVGFGVNAQGIKEVFTSTDNATTEALAANEKSSEFFRKTVDIVEENGEYQYSVEWTQQLVEDLKHFDITAKLEWRKVIFSIPKWNPLLSINVTKNQWRNGIIEYSYTIKELPYVEPTEPINLSTPEEMERSVERALAGTKLADNIYSMNRNNPQFDKNVIVNISNGNYQWALDYIKTMSPANIRKSLLDAVTTNGQIDENKMKTLLTYTYGAVQVKNLSNKNGDAVSIDADVYKESRRSSLAAESRVVSEFAWEKISPNEKFFEGKQHTQKEAKDVFPNQKVALSVIATPKARDTWKQAGTDRIDHFDHSISISNHTTEISSDKLKDALIRAYDQKIDAELATVNAALQGHANISKDQYIQILKWKNPSKLDVPIPELSVEKSAQFFEGRAMVHGNICNNLTYGLAFPSLRFSKNGMSGTIPQGMETSVYGTNVSAVNVKEVSAGYVVEWNKEKETEETKEEEPPKQETETTPTPDETTVDTSQTPPPPSQSVPPTTTDIPKPNIPPESVPQTVSNTTTAGITSNTASAVSGTENAISNASSIGEVADTVKIVSDIPNTSVNIGKSVDLDL